MAGHSKWNNIKRKKAKEDKKRAKIFTKLIRKITVAAREGGGDPEYNPRLRLAIDRANDANMPKENIERAIKRGTGELEGVDYEEYTYEGYGPGGVAVMLDVVTDNRNRSVAEIRHLFDSHEGNLGEDGCVAWQFELRGLIQIEDDTVEDGEELLLTAIEAGAQDVQTDEVEGDRLYEIYTDYERLHDVDEALRESGYEIAESELTRVPNTTIPLDGSDARKFLRLYDDLEDHDDVQNVYANFEIPDGVMEDLGR